MQSHRITTRQTEIKNWKISSYESLMTLTLTLNQVI